MSLKKLVAAFVVVLSMFVAAPKSASAATIAFDVCTGVDLLCGHLFMTTTLNAGKLDVSVFADPGYGIFGKAGGQNQGGAFALNVNGTGVTFSNLTAGFSYTGGGGAMPSNYGNFEYMFEGPQQGSNATLPFNFTVSRDGGFSSDLQLFEANANGFWAAADLRVPGGPLTGNVASNTSPVPEPATLLLLGTGLLVAVRARRKKTS